VWQDRPQINPFSSFSACQLSLIENQRALPRDMTLVNLATVFNQHQLAALENLLGLPDAGSSIASGLSLCAGTCGGTSVPSDVMACEL
jgi:hypothetical protein